MIRRTLFGLVVLAFAVLSVLGVTWGLPSRAYDPYLFPNGKVWPGERIHRLAGAEGKLAPEQACMTGADVDVDPLERRADRAVSLTATDEDVAKILIRYRLYTFQPDEMITMMALAGMRPGRLDLDPRLYQYGGLFIYAVGALIKLCGMLGLIEVRSDVVYYLDHPDEFGKFYVVGRLYAAAWGVLGVLAVCGIARRLATGRPSDESRIANEGRARRHGERSEASPVPERSPSQRSFAALRMTAIPEATAGLLAAVLFTLLPVVVCMSHEAKPHLPGAVLMLAAVWFAVRHFQGGRGFCWMCVCCGAAVGMVLSAGPVLVLIPLTAIVVRPRTHDQRRATRFGAILQATTVGVVLAAAVYLLTNPYVLINAFTNRAVLRSNFGNSLAMYEVARIGEGFRRVLDLTIEGATLPVLILGCIAAVAAIARGQRAALLLIVPAGVFFLQFVLIGAGKPGEYGRFGIFTNAALAIGTACLMATQLRAGRSASVCLAILVVIGWVGYAGAAYLRNFCLDTTPRGSRLILAAQLAKRTSAADDVKQPRPAVALLAEPAPYNCPPLDFQRTPVQLVRSTADSPMAGGGDQVLLHPVDVATASSATATPDDRLWPRQTPISWANKPFVTRNVE